MKKISMMAAAIMMVAMVSCKKDPKKVDADGVDMNYATYSLEVGDEFTLEATVSPSNATDQNITWSSDAESVATVVGGKVTAVAKGNTTIKAANADGTFFAICKVTVSEVPDMTKINTTTPVWGTDNLGTVSFASDKTWEKGGLTWSDVVVASACIEKASFKGGNQTNGYDADCRKNYNITPGNMWFPADTADFKGSLFSGAAVLRFRKAICPDGWRVPTKDDFEALDKALGGTGATQDDATLKAKYLSDWGAELNGWSNSSTTATASFVYSKLTGAYWSITPQDAAGNNYVLQIGKEVGSYPNVTYTTVAPDANINKTNGLAVRCVR